MSITVSNLRLLTYTRPEKMVIKIAGRRIYTCGIQRIRFTNYVFCIHNPNTFVSIYLLTLAGDIILL